MDFCLGNSCLESEMDLSVRDRCFDCYSVRLVKFLTDRGIHQDCFIYAAGMNMKSLTRNYPPGRQEELIARSVDKSQFEFVEIDIGSQIGGKCDDEPVSFLLSDVGARLIDKTFGCNSNKYRQSLMGCIVSCQARLTHASGETIHGKLLECNGVVLNCRGVSAYSCYKNCMCKGAHKGFNTGKLMLDILNLRPGKPMKKQLEAAIKKLDISMASVQQHLQQLLVVSHGTRIEVTVEWNQFLEARRFLAEVWREIAKTKDAIIAVKGEDHHQYLLQTARSFYLPMRKSMEDMMTLQPGPNNHRILQEALFTLATFLCLYDGAFWTGSTQGCAQPFVFNAPSAIHPITLDGHRVIKDFNFLLFCWNNADGQLDGPFDPFTMRFKAGWFGNQAFDECLGRMLVSSARALSDRQATEAALTMQVNLLLAKAGDDLPLVAAIVVKSYVRHLSDQLGLESWDLRGLDSALSLKSGEIGEVRGLDGRHSVVTTGVELERLLETRLKSTANGLKDCALKWVLQHYEVLVKNAKTDKTPARLLANAFRALELDLVHVPGLNLYTDCGHNWQFLKVDMAVPGPVSAVADVTPASSYQPATAEEKEKVAESERDLDGRSVGGAHLPWTVAENAMFLVAMENPSFKRSDDGCVDWESVLGRTEIFLGRRNLGSMANRIKQVRKNPDSGSLGAVREVINRHGIVDYKLLPRDPNRCKSADDLDLAIASALAEQAAFLPLIDQASVDAAREAAERERRLGEQRAASLFDGYQRRLREMFASARVIDINFVPSPISLERQAVVSKIPRMTASSSSSKGTFRVEVHQDAFLPVPTLPIPSGAAVDLFRADPYGEGGFKAARQATITDKDFETTGEDSDFSGDADPLDAPVMNYNLRRKRALPSDDESEVEGIAVGIAAEKSTETCRAASTSLKSTSFDFIGLDSISDSGSFMPEYLNDDGPMMSDGGFDCYAGEPAFQNSSGITTFFVRLYSLSFL